MTETTTNCIKRLTRLLEEEFKPRDIGFVLVIAVAVPDEPTQRLLGVTSNVDPGEAMRMLDAVGAHINSDEIHFLNATDPEGHA